VPRTPPIERGLLPARGTTVDLVRRDTVFRPPRTFRSEEPHPSDGPTRLSLSLTLRRELDDSFAQFLCRFPSGPARDHGQHFVGRLKRVLVAVYQDSHLAREFHTAAGYG